MVLSSITWGLSSTPMGSGGLLKFSLGPLVPAELLQSLWLNHDCATAWPWSPLIQTSAHKRTDWLNFSPASSLWSCLKTAGPDPNPGGKQKRQAYNPTAVKLFHSDNSRCPICHPLSGGSLQGSCCTLMFCPSSHLPLFLCAVVCMHIFGCFL